MTVNEMAAKLESTLLRADAGTADYQRLCEEALSLGVAVVCVPLSRVVLAVHLLEGSGVKVGRWLVFPWGTRMRTASVIRWRRRWTTGPRSWMWC